jgi:hypothetical protein
MTNEQPGGAKPVGFASDIRPLFTEIDIDHMSWYCDLSNYNDVRTKAQQILRRLKAQGGPVMPPPPNKGGDGPWSADKIAVFESWINGGCQP